MDFKKNPDTDFKPIDDLSKKEAKAEVEALREGLEYHNHRYYVKNDPVVSDEVFARLFARLQELVDFPALGDGVDNSSRRRSAPWCGSCFRAAPAASSRRSLSCRR